MEITSQSTGLAGDLTGKLREFYEQVIARLVMFWRACLENLNRFVKSVGRQRRKFRDKLLHDVFHIFSVPVNYDGLEIFAELKAGEFDVLEYRGIAPGEIPLVGSGRITRTVHEVCFSRVMYDHDMIAELRKRGRGFGRGFQFVDPPTAFRFVATHRDRLKKHPLAVNFTDQAGKDSWLFFYEEAGKRHFCCLRGSHGNRLKAGTCFLAVRG